MKILAFAILMMSASAFADDCSNKALRGALALAKINHFRVYDLKVTGTVMTEGDGTRLLLTGHDRRNRDFKFTADVAQSEGPCVLLTIGIGERP